MIQTYRALSVLTLPGDIAGLLDGYCGHIEVAHYGDRSVWEPGVIDGETCALNDEAAGAEYVGTLGYMGTDHNHGGDGSWVRPSSRLRLPLSCHDACYRAACWLAEGGGSGLAPRAPAPCWWALSPGPSTLPGWVCRAVVHASVLRVAAGMKPVVGVARWIAQHCGWCVQGGPILTVDYLSLLDGYALLDGDQLRIDIPAEPGGEQE